ncbi:MAG: hypothetical protein ACOVQ6_05520 [Brevundimonas sp.]
MRTLTALMTGATLIALTPTLVAADDLQLSFPVHNITVTSNIPALSISIRNQSQSTNPAQRNLRVVSQTPVLHVSGEVRCKSFPNANTRADAAQVIYGGGVLTPSGDTATAFVGGWSASPVIELGDDQEARNFSINAPLNLPNGGGVFSYGFNPVHYVEERMQKFVQNGAGSEADFLRVDDVFETTIRMNVVGWCEYQNQSLYGRYAGFRQMTVPVRIFYHGDPDIEDQMVGVGAAKRLQAPPPGTGPTVAPGRTPPRARPSQPVRGSDPEARRPTGAAADALPASMEMRAQHRQQVVAPPPRRQLGPQLQQPAPGNASQSGVAIAGGDVNGDSAVGLLLPAVQKMREPPAAPAGEPNCNELAPTLRREATRAVAGLLLGASRARREAERPSLRDRLIDTVANETAGCRPATADPN